jgi:general secretion pathway protein B
MSFILDALKKSESERQRKGAPGIADVPKGNGRSGAAKWYWILGALLAVNLAVLIGLLLRPDAGPAPTADLRPEPKATTKESVPAAKTFSEIVADVKAELPARTEAVTTAPAGPPSPQPSIADERPAAAPARARVVDGLPTVNELRADGLLQLPDLHLDIHVYSVKPADRFVFVNMSRYRENATLAEGPQIREITPEGVILEHLGTRFLLPRE